MTIDKIEQIAPGVLNPWARNARTHSRQQIRQIADSIETFGFTNPVLVDGAGTILAGHGRVEAAKRLGLPTVPCRRIEHLSAAEKRAYVLADNKLALNAGWDEDLLAKELGAILEIEDLSFDIGITGFSVAEIDAALGAPVPKEPGDPADDIVPIDAPRRVRAGDVWALGRHRLMCGDARDPDVVALLMDGARARMVFSDPPYNVAIDGHVGNSGRVQHREFAMASGEITTPEFIAFLDASLRNMADASLDGSIHFLCMDWRHMAEMLAAGHAVYDELKNLIVWVKDNVGMGSFYRSRHELVFAFKKGTAPHINNFELGQHGRDRTNVRQYKGVNTLRARRMEELSLHSTAKPVEMIADAIRDVSGGGEIVFALFGGSGSTLIAAENTGRCGDLVEYDPGYCDRIL
ncbi:MAG: DNA methyltransferase, partial [Pseudomonadota bacterium]